MPSRILFANTNAEAIQEARSVAPAGFELVIAAPGTARYTDAPNETEYLLGNVDGRAIARKHT